MDEQPPKKQPEDGTARNAPEQASAQDGIRLPGWLANWRSMRDKLHGGADAETQAKDSAARKEAVAAAKEDIKSEAITRILAKEAALREDKARQELVDTLRELFTYKTTGKTRETPAAGEPVVEGTPPQAAIENPQAEEKSPRATKKPGRISRKRKKSPFPAAPVRSHKNLYGTVKDEFSAMAGKRRRVTTGARKRVPYATRSKTRLAP
ncbi:MAG: hypothetical protein KGL10_08920 [Alphaproteobacteria bacterium]|nr:hypothetical protein [Alphaproteobacteria bacterium]MDE2337421.1 hypothetical protein [Alphaproteobacteria bacterium]